MPLFEDDMDESSFSEIALAIASLSWPQLDALFDQANLSWRDDVDVSAKAMHLYRQLEGRRPDELERLVALARSIEPEPESAGFFSLFISHCHQQREIAGALREALVSYGVDAFVAHDAIEFDQAWQDIIVTRLNTCFALLAIVSAEFPASAWCDQEVGWALGRGIPVMSINAGKAPYGFFGVRQALPFKGDPSDLASRVSSRLLEMPSTGLLMTSALVAALENAGSYDEATRLVALLGEAQVWDSSLLRRVELTPARNDQVRYGDYGRLPSRIPKLVASKRKASG